ncbi:uncharacterized protein LOC105436503 [Strongylocentrotus purpuratus]|uniref:EGF-like domain-containing protein n=1 Tax=Strongylocentrotus purpuratus TaxID=7668 RepID=A0A7M7NBS7_STRPU|nr:uncharacterized protein LOC105436503 [Strongylocentrotus purpuratus]
MVQWQYTRFSIGDHPRTSSVTNMLLRLQWPILEERRAQYKLIMMYLFIIVTIIITIIIVMINANIIIIITITTMFIINTSITIIVGMYYPDGTLRHLELTLDDLVTGSNYGVQGSWLFEVSDTFREIGKVLCEPTNPCLNEGTCENDTCVCPEGFSGNFCHLDGCDNRCLNGASCEQGNCTCPAGFGGDFCQDKLTFVECGSTSMTVNIDERLVPGEASAVHFKDRSCSGVKNDSTNEITLTTEYNQCGTIIEVYIHCSVKVCGAEEAQLLRDAECPADIEPPPPARKRRSSSVMSTQTISNGPIRIRRSTSDMATNVTTDVASFNPFAMLLLGMIATLVAMAILMGVVKLARFKPDIRYQQVPIESMEGI